MRRVSVLRARRITAYVSDVEGSTTYWEKYLASSRILQRNPETRKIEFKSYIAPGDDAPAETHFVFGGDAVDKGGDDLDFVADLNQLKRDHPDRVTLLIGNRDVNKMRMRVWASPEFQDMYLDRTPASEVGIPYFMANAAPNVMPYAAFVEASARNRSSRSRLLYTKWRLEHTMGCQGLFESRRQQLMRTKAQPLATADVTDEEVLESFFASVRPGGAIHEYLSHAQLSATINNTLFIHGGVTPENAGYVPTQRLLDIQADTLSDEAFEAAWFNVLNRGGSIQEWSDALNQFWRDSFTEWDTAGQLMDAATGRFAGSSATAYAHMKATKGRTVMIRTFTNQRGPHFMDLGIVEHCNVSGIFRMVAGHKPVGDVPLTIQQPGMSIHVVDNSYCHVKGASPDGRGEAVQELLIDDTEGTASAHGRRADGTPFEFALDDPSVGLPLSDGWWTRGALAGSGAEAGDSKHQPILAHRTTDDFFTNAYKVVSRGDVEQHTVDHPMKSVADGDFFERYTRSELKPMKRKVLRPFEPAASAPYQDEHTHK